MIEVPPTAFGPLTLTSEVWPWPLTFTFNLTGAIVVTHSNAKGQNQRSLGSQVTIEQTDGRTETIALPRVLTLLQNTHYHGRQRRAVCRRSPENRKRKWRQMPTCWPGCWCRLSLSQFNVFRRYSVELNGNIPERQIVANACEGFCCENYNGVSVTGTTVNNSASRRASERHSSAVTATLLASNDAKKIARNISARPIETGWQPPVLAEKHGTTVHARRTRRAVGPARTVILHCQYRCCCCWSSRWCGLGERPGCDVTHCVLSAVRARAAVDDLQPSDGGRSNLNPLQAATPRHDWVKILLPILNQSINSCLL